MARYKLTLVYDGSNFNGSQRQVPQAELDWRENQVGHEIDGERQGHPPRHLAPERLHEHEAESCDYNWVEDLPNQADGRWCRRPAWFPQSCIPFQPCHT